MKRHLTDLLDLFAVASLVAAAFLAFGLAAALAAFGGGCALLSWAIVRRG